MKAPYVKLCKSNICNVGKAFWPWLDPNNKEFSKYEQKSGNLTLLIRPSRYYLYTLAKQTLYVRGDWIECGVYKGGSALILDYLLYDYKMNKILSLVDSFEGLPEPSEFDNSNCKGGFACEDISIFSNSLVSKDVDIIKGWIPEAFNDLNSTVFSFAHIDTDFYKPALDSCNFIYPRLSTSGIILFDNYGSPNCKGEKKAVDEFFSDKPENVIILPTTQAFVIKV